MAHSIEADLKRVPGTREVTTIGGPGRAVLVEIDPARLAGVGVTVADLRAALLSANLGLPVGELIAGNRALRDRVGPVPGQRRRSRRRWWSACTTRKPVFLRRRGDAARRPAACERYVWHGMRGQGARAANTRR